MFVLGVYVCVSMRVVVLDSRMCVRWLELMQDGL